MIVPTLLFVLSCALLIIPDKIRLKKGFSAFFILFLLIITVIDLFRFGWKFTPFTDAGIFFPETQAISYLKSQPHPFRVMSVDDRLAAPNTFAYFGIESVSGYDPVYAGRYEKFIAAMERNKPDIAGPYGFNRIISPKKVNSPLFRILNPKYILSLDEIQDNRFTQVFTEGQTRIYENIDVLQRVYFIREVISANTEQEVMDKLYSRDFNAVTQAVVEGANGYVASPQTSGEFVTMKSYGNDAMNLSVNSGEKRFVFIGNIYDKGWNAYIDGVPAKIYITDFTYMGIFVSAGTHNIELKYQPIKL
jgi:hypothetical protein